MSEKHVCCPNSVTVNMAVAAGQSLVRERFGPHHPEKLHFSVPIRLFGQICHHPHLFMRCLDSCKADQLGGTTQFGICVRAGRLCTC